MAAMASALYQLTNRRVGADDRSETSLLYGTLWGTVFALPATAVAFQMPSGWQWAVLAFTGFCGSLGHYLLIAAYRITPASLLAPFSYTQIIWMMLLGFVLFGNIPDIWTVVGGVVVVASGLYVLRREKMAETAP
jgi:drug/metabolite transporter (DMT)-like permease